MDMNTTTNETAPWRSPSGKYAVRWVHLTEGWRFWAFEIWTGADVGAFVSKAAAILACEAVEAAPSEEATTAIPVETMRQLVNGRAE